MVCSPKVTDAAVIEEQFQNRRVLNQPAGHLECGETPIEAVKREVREETARKFTPHGLVGVYLWPLDTSTTCLRFCFAGSVSQRLPERPLDPDIIETRWLDVRTLRVQRSRLRGPMVLRCVQDALNRPLVVLEILRDIDL